MNFSEDLWDGFEAASKQASSVSDFSEDLAKALEKFSSLSSSYAKGLVSLSKTKASVPAEGNYASVGASWTAFLEMTERLGGIFSTLSEETDRVSNEVTKHEKDHKKQRKNLNSAGSKLIAELLKTESAASKARQKFLAAKKKHEESLQEYNGAKETQTVNVVTKLGKKVEADQKSSEKADKELHKGVEMLRACQEKVFHNDMPKLLSELQGLEEERIDFLKGEFTSASNSQLKIVPEIQTCFDRFSSVVGSMDTRADIQHFITKNKTHRHLTLSTYDNYEGESALGGGGSGGHASVSSMGSPSVNSGRESPSTPGSARSTVVMDSPREPKGAPSVTSIPVHGKRVLCTVYGLYDYKANDENELSFPANAEIKVYEKDPSGWWTGEYQGQTGNFPSNYVSDSPSAADNQQEQQAASHESGSNNNNGGSRQYRALYEYTANEEDEFTFVEGDIFTFESEEDGWLFVYDKDGHYGRVPNTYVEAI